MTDSKVNASAVIQQPAPLQQDGNLANNWKEWLSSFQYFLTAVGKDSATQKEKCALFMHVIGKYGREIFEELDVSDTEKQDYAILCKKFADQCSPTKNINYERHMFFETYQNEKEFDKYLCELKVNSKTCDFGTLRNSLILTQMIRGVKDNNMREKMLAITTLTLEDATQWCRAAERAGRQGAACEASAARASSSGAGAVEVEQLRGAPARGRWRPRPYDHARRQAAATATQPPRNSKPSGSVCGKCAYVHAGDRCPASTVRCRKCNFICHYARCGRVRFTREVVENDSYGEESGPGDGDTATNGAGSGPGGGERRGGDVTPHAQPQRRLIKVDFDNLEDDEDEDDTEPCSPEVVAPQPYPRHTAPQHAPKPWKRTASTAAEEPPRAPPRSQISHDEYHQFCDEALESYDLATQCPSRRASMRRHTVTHPACPLPTDGAQSLPHSRPASRGSCAGAASLASSEADAQLNELSWSRSSLQDELIKSVSGSPVHGRKQWQDAIMSDDRLSLTLEEIVHIRSVLTKAELEVLPVEGRVKEDVEKRRVCFLCLKTRFGIFGPWGQKCKLCKKTVCQKCCSKMRIPTEHFAHVPVVLLSPSLLPSPEEEPHSSFPRSLMSRLVSPDHPKSTTENSVGSAPNSPASTRRAQAHSAPGSRGGSALGYCDTLSVPPASMAAMSRSVDGPESMCGTTPNALDRRARYNRSTTGITAAERLRGVQMAVCHDCKAMVLQIIKSSRASRSASRDRALRHLTLDLAPVYTADC